MGTVDFGGIRKDICLAYMPEAEVGDYVIVHVGFAISQIDEAEAAGDPAPVRRARRSWTRSSRTTEVGDAEERRREVPRRVPRPRAGRTLLDEIARTTTRPWTIMEVCGGQTHAIVRFGIDQLLPDEIDADPRPRLPGLRHPARDHRQGAGHRLPAGGDLLLLRRHAARARLSERDLLARRRRRAATCGSSTRRWTRVTPGPSNPDRRGRLLRRRLRDHGPGQRHGRAPGRTAGASTNFSVLVPTCWCRRPSRRSLASPSNRVQGFLAAGHVCAVMGTWEYGPLASAYRRADRGHRLRAARPPRGDPSCRAAARGRAGPRWRTPYARAVTAEGNSPAQAMVDDVFEVCDRQWRGIGEIPRSGWRLARALSGPSTPRCGSVSAELDAPESELCRSGRGPPGPIKPHECPAFGSTCTPAHRSARRWCRARGPAPPTTSTGDSTGAPVEVGSVG